MNFNKLIDDCTTIEDAISMLVSENARGQIKLSELQAKVIKQAKTDLDVVIKKEQELTYELEALARKRDNLELEVNKSADINGKLAQVVKIAQASDSDKSEIDRRDNQIYLNITDAIQEYEQITDDFIKARTDIAHIFQDLIQDKEAGDKIIDESEQLINSLHINDNIIRLMDQQNKFAEQQFDLILSQLPWEPLAPEYIDKLRSSDDTSIRSMAEVLQIQENEIQDLNRSLSMKKTLKLKILDQLFDQLNDFVRKREEAILMGQCA